MALGVLMIFHFCNLSSSSSRGPSSALSCMVCWDQFFFNWERWRDFKHPTLVISPATSRDAGGWKNNLELIVEKLAFFGQAFRPDFGFSALNCRVILLVLIWCTTASITEFCKKSGCIYCLFSRPVTNYVLPCFGNPLSFVFHRWASL